MQEVLTDLEPRCGNPECGDALAPGQRRFCGQRCSSRARFLRELERCRDLTHKVCRKCEVNKPLGEFRNPGVLWCQECMKEKRRSQYRKRGGRDYVYGAHLERAYGMTLEQYHERVEQQNGRCAICDEEPEARDRLHVDHNHQTGVVRDLLCRACNHALGNVKDDPGRLLAMVAYLERHAHRPIPSEAASVQASASRM